MTGVAIFRPTAGSAYPGAPQPRLSVGGSARVAQLYSRVRPGVRSNCVSYVMLAGDTAEVLDGSPSVLASVHSIGIRCA